MKFPGWPWEHILPPGNERKLSPESTVSMLRMDSFNALFPPQCTLSQLTPRWTPGPIFLLVKQTKSILAWWVFPFCCLKEREMKVFLPFPQTNNPWERLLLENESLMLCLHYRAIILVPTANIYYQFILVIYLRNSFLAMLSYAEFILLKQNLCQKPQMTLTIIKHWSACRNRHALRMQHAFFLHSRDRGKWGVNSPWTPKQLSMRSWFWDVPNSRCCSASLVGGQGVAPNPLEQLYISVILGSPTCMAKCCWTFT